MDGHSWRVRNTFVEVIPEHVDAHRISDTELLRSSSEPPPGVVRILDSGVVFDMGSFENASHVPDPEAPPMIDTSSSGSSIEVSDTPTQPTPLNALARPALVDITNTDVVRHRRWVDMTDDLEIIDEPEAEPDPDALECRVLSSTWPFE